MDGDLSAGTIQFQLKLENRDSILDAVRRWRELDERLWIDLTAQQGALYVPHAGGSDFYPNLEADDVHELIQLARSLYGVNCVDLGHNLSPFTTEFLRESRHIFLVTICDLSCVDWAAARMARFKEFGIADRVTVRINWQPSHRALLSPEEVAGTLDHRPQLCVNEDRKSADQAALDGAQFCLTPNWDRRSPTWRSRWFRHTSPFAPRRRRGIGFSNFSSASCRPSRRAGRIDPAD